MEIIILDNGRMINNRDWVYTDGLMEIYTRVYGGIVYLTGKVNLDGLMEMYTMVK